MATKIVIDPITRIEGHLRIEAQVENGVVTDAWSAGTMFRGIEIILKGRDPREAWMLAQRICGVCTTVHAICSVRAIENALGLTVPDNPRILRNVIEAAQFVHDHVMHFYHLHALDWVDVTSALNANTTTTSNLQKSLSSWSNNSATYFDAVKTRLKTLVGSGQLGIFANGYWGHPAYKLPPEANLMLVAHYLEALDFQREYIKIHAYLGGKSPHPQTYAVGGMAIPLDRTNSNSITPAKIDTLKTLAQKGLDFVSKVYVPDVLAAAKFYPEWANTGGGVGNFLAFGDFPLSSSTTAPNLYLQRGYVLNKNLASAPNPIDQTKIKEYVTHSWYTYSGGNSVGLHPSVGQTAPSYTGPMEAYQFLDTTNKYSWLKTPRYNELPMEVGPLARMVVAYAAGHARVRAVTDSVLGAISAPSSALFSTLGRIAARAIETQVLAEQLGPWLDQLKANINAGNVTSANTTKWNPSTWPATFSGWGTTEAPRGALGHWVSVANGKITSYQCVVPTTWNGSPRDARGVRGPFEQSLIGTPVADINRPLEILRTIHSFDPCLSCAVHIVDAKRKPLMAISNSLLRQ